VKTSNADEALSTYLNFVPQRDLRPDRERGRADGQVGYPPEEQEDFSSYEMTLVYEIRRDLNRYKSWIQEDLDEVQRKLVEKRQMRDEVYPAQKLEISNDRSNDMAQLNASIGKNSDGYRLADREAREAERALRTHERQLNRPPRMRFRRPRLFGRIEPYLIVLTFLAILEIPVNIPIFTNALNLPNLFALLASLGMGAVFIFVAHALGIMLVRRAGAQDASGGVKRRASVAPIVVLSLLLLLTFAVLATGRVEDQAGADTGNILRGLAQDFLPGDTAVGQAVGDAAQTAGNAVTTFLNNGTWLAYRTPLILFLFSLIVFVVGIILSVYRHDPDPDYEGLVDRHEKAQARFAALHGRWEQRRVEINRYHDERESQVTADIDREQNEIDGLLAEIEQIMTQYDQRVEMMKEVVRARISAYQEGNISTRPTGRPTYFGARGLAMLNHLLDTDNRGPRLSFVAGESDGGADGPSPYAAKTNGSGSREYV